MTYSPFDENAERFQVEDRRAKMDRQKRYVAKVASSAQVISRGPDRSMHPDFLRVVHYFMTFCNARGANTFPRPVIGLDTNGNLVHGAVDPLEMARMAGRREAFDEFVRLSRMPAQELHLIKTLSVDNIA